MLEVKPAHERPWERQRLEVPRDDETLFSRPPLAEAPEFARRNRDSLASSQIDIQGRSLETLRRWARESALQAAGDYTRQLVGDAPDTTEIETIIAGGHQPSLFHPGVWVKNFALGHLAANTHGVGLNLVIDNDAMGGAAVRVPVGDPAQPSRETIAFDAAAAPGIPWEEARVADPESFASFGDRVSQAMSRWKIEPLAAQIWPIARRQLSHTDSLRDCLTAARVELERQWGLQNLELPISVLCQTDPFLWFASHLLAQLPDFRGTYNQVLHEFRNINRVRSHTHPVPELRSDGQWLEAPFWVWREDDTTRRPLFARQQGREVLLSDGREEFCRLPLSPNMDACCAVEVLRDLPQQGIRLRTRALTTTLFVRLCIADMFVHGIGGAKYDEMTDRIIARHFKLSAPSIMAMSATLHLPLNTSWNVSEQDARRLQWMLRDLDYNSDRHLQAGTYSEIDALIAEKQSLVSQQQVWDRGDHTPAERRAHTHRNRDRFTRLKDVNRRLADHTRTERSHIEQELETVEQRLQANEILDDREYSFCLYPEDKLRPFLTNLG